MARDLEVAELGLEFRPRRGDRPAPAGPQVRPGAGQCRFLEGKPGKLLALCHRKFLLHIFRKRHWQPSLRHELHINRAHG